MKFTIRLIIILSLVLTSQSFFAQESTISLEKAADEAKTAKEHQNKINNEHKKLEKHQREVKNAEKSI